MRLLDQQLAGQIGWLLPLALAGLLAAGSQSWPRFPLDRRQAALVLWEIWLCTAAAYFSVSGYGHRHYLVMLAPAIAALVGIGTAALWKDYQRMGWRGWLLPLVLVSMAAVQAYILTDYPDWSGWLTPVIAALCLISAGSLIFIRLKAPFRARAYAVSTASMGVLALLIAPAAWATYDTLVHEGGGPLPAAGPRPAEAEGGPGGPPGSPGGGPPPGGPPPRGRGGPGGNADPALVEYLIANKGNAQYLVAVPNAMGASPIILNTDERVITLCGFMGRDPVFTDELANLVNKGAVRFFLLPDRERMEEMMAEREAEDAYSQGGGPPPGAPQGPPPGGPPGMDNEAVSWVRDNCGKVPQELW